ncbi:MAG: LytTR family transcriptional regulator DNA-binding domain-containing protein [Clostridia bacterium]|nr:LytTR family transcriptional regulator DNA-binding domain-containing protein [Clostridia bacterium]
MSSVVYDMAKKDETKAKVIKILNDNEIAFEITNCCGFEKICIDLNGENECCNEPCCSRDLIVQTSNKDVCRIHPSEIIYIAIESRKSAVYVDGKRIETNLPLEYWKDTLNPKIFTQPHSSFLVNLNYVEEVTKDFVIMKYKDEEYSVYTSTRKINDFKKAFLEFGK